MAPGYILKRPLPNGVTYDLSFPDHVTITLPSGSTWSTGLHWHEQHVEYLRVIKGRVRVRLGNTVHTISATNDDTQESNESAEEFRVEENMRHEWCRADLEGEDVVVVERTEPMDGEKSLFFWNLNGEILDAQAWSRNRAGKKRAIASGFAGRSERIITELWVTLNLFVIFRSLDNFPVLVDLSKLRAVRSFGSMQLRLTNGIEGFLTHLALRIASVLAWILEVEPVKRQYTPEDTFRS